MNFKSERNVRPLQSGTLKINKRRRSLFVIGENRQVIVGQSTLIVVRGFRLSLLNLAKFNSRFFAEIITRFLSFQTLFEIWRDAPPRVSYRSRMIRFASINSNRVAVTDTLSGTPRVTRISVFRSSIRPLASDFCPVRE